MKERILVSACLAGMRCSYKGEDNINFTAKQLYMSGVGLAVCPECMGGLPVPRLLAERMDGKVVDINGRDITTEFYKGAERVLNLALDNGVQLAILKSKSPSCGKNKIYNGEFNGTLVDGNGVLVDLLLENGIEVISEEEIPENFFDRFR